MTEIHAPGYILKIEHYGGRMFLTSVSAADPADTVEVHFLEEFEDDLPQRLAALAQQLAGARPPTDEPCL